MTKRGTRKSEPATAAAAAKLARQGLVADAIPILERLAAAGDVPAAAALAEVRAFEGDWRAVADLAPRLLARPDAVYAGNVFTDQCGLLRRAARTLDRMDLIDAAAAVVPARYQRMARACLLQDEERVEIVQNPAAFTAGLREAEKMPRLRNKPDAVKDRHAFSLAVTFGMDEEVINRWNPANPELGFDQAVEVARALVRRERSSEVWPLLESRIGAWWPLEATQVAPVVLLVDRALAPFVSAGDARTILATPRGDGRAEPFT